MIIVMRGAGNGIPVSGAAMAARALTVLFFLGLIATGVILSFNKPANHFVKIIHAALPLLAAASAFVNVYLIRGK